MASIAHDKSNSTYTIRIVGADGKRRSLRLGKVPKKLAESIRLKVEHIDSLGRARMPMDAETATWVGGIGDDLAAKLAAIGLIPERHSANLEAFLLAYLDRRMSNSKPGTVVTIERVVIDLFGFFGRATSLRAITAVRADDFLSHYQTREPKLASATIARRIKMARMLFKHAEKLKLIPVNPFADVTAKNGNSEARQHYITREETHQLIDAANPIWRTIIALARFAGLRCPSEVLSLKWENVDFAKKRMTVSFPKTAHLEGKAYRIVPIFGSGLAMC